MPSQSTNKPNSNSPKNILADSEKTRKMWAKNALWFGIFGIISNMLCCLPGGIPVSVASGIFGIAFALLSRENNKFPTKSKIGIILSAISIIVGFVLFYFIISVFDALKNPETGNYYFNYIEDLINSMPANTQDTIRSFYGM